MQVVINISEKTKEFFDSNNCMNDTGWITHLCELINAFRKGTTLPAGHGRLIDADAAKCSNCGKFGCENSDICSLYHAQTIIKADGGAE